MIKYIDYLIFHLDCLYKKMDKFKYKDRGTEKFWLSIVSSIFLGMIFSSLDNILFNNYFYKLSKYSFHLFGLFSLCFIYFFFIKNERFLDYDFKESYKGYVSLLILFIIMIMLMAMVQPIKQ